MRLVMTDTVEEYCLDVQGYKLDMIQKVNIVDYFKAVF